MAPGVDANIADPAALNDAIRTNSPSKFHSETNETRKSPVTEANDSLSQVSEPQVLSGHEQSSEATQETVQSEMKNKPEVVVAPDTDLESADRWEKLKGRQARIQGGEESDNVTTRPSSPADDYEDSLVGDLLQHRYSWVRSATLYKAYQTRMRKRDKNSNKGGDLITAMVDYVTKMEDDMARLEKTLDDMRLTRGVKTDELADELAGELSDELAGEGADTAQSPIKDQAGVAIETRFYHCNGVAFASDGSMRNGDGKFESGHYLSATDPVHLLRVLYAWKDEVEPNASAAAPGDAPDNGKVDIIAFMISSKPIADFFEKRLGLSTDVTRVVRIGKPFRSIIRNISQLRSHLLFLENRYGSVSTGVDASGAPQGTEVEAGNGGNTEGSPIHPDSKNINSTYTTKKDTDGSKESGDEADKTEEEEFFDSASALPHFRHLIRFIDQYLGKKVGLFENLQAGRAEQVVYEDLWMLFDTGDTIYCPLRQGGMRISNTDEDDDHTTKRRYVPQAYRVVATVGGAPLQQTLAPRNTTAGYDNSSEDALIRLFTNRANMSAGLEMQPTSLNLPRAQSMREKYSALHVICMYIDFNGVKYGAETEIFVFKPFDGKMDIQSLEAFPLQYLRTGRATESSSVVNIGQSSDPAPRDTGYADDLVERGRKFIDVTAVSRHMSHTGLTVGESKEEINSAVIVDLKLAFTEYQKSFPDADSVVPMFNPLTKFWPELPREILDFSTSCSDLYCHDRECIQNAYYNNQKRQLAKLEPTIKQWLENFDNLTGKDEENIKFKAYMQEKDLIQLLPGVVPGFSLRNRVWVQLNLDQLKYVEQQDDWNKLVLPKGHRKIVQAMVENHSRGSGSTTSVQDNKVEMDLVRGKGRGCIILLHGVPGVGKTSTAECVASYTKRPLYPITCGDIGYEPEAVEIHMGKHFRLAHRWGCVLLLDEADVFLAKRNKSDVKRNGLVSSFLRILEYYSGILFLTTNRVGALDDAFRSRLHLTLYYPQLTEKQTIKIWKANLERLEDIKEERVINGRPPIQFDKKKILNWVKKHWHNIQWNGRQIRNAFQTAMALAEFEAKQLTAKSPGGSTRASPVLDIEKFKLLATTSAQFTEYLLETHGDGEEDIAVRDQVRAVRFKPKTKVRDFSDEDNDEDSDEESSGSGESGSGSEEGSSEESDASDESQSEDSGQGRREKSKKTKKHAKDQKAKSKSSKDERKDKGKGKGRRK